MRVNRSKTPHSSKRCVILMSDDDKLEAAMKSVQREQRHLRMTWMVEKDIEEPFKDYTHTKKSLERI